MTPSKEKLFYTLIHQCDLSKKEAKDLLLAFEKEIRIDELSKVTTKGYELLSDYLDDREVEIKNNLQFDPEEESKYFIHVFNGVTYKCKRYADLDDGTVKAIVTDDNGVEELVEFELNEVGNILQGDIYRATGKKEDDPGNHVWYSGDDQQGNWHSYKDTDIIFIVED